jgi:hypothetical protein
LDTDISTSFLEVSRRTTSEEVVGDTGSNLVTGREPFFFPEASGSDFLADGLSAKIKEPTGTLSSKSGSPTCSETKRGIQ